LYGFNVFQFQVAYNKGCNETLWAEYVSGRRDASPCPERDFGLFALGDGKVGTTGLVPSGTGQAWRRYDVFCVKPASEGKGAAVARAFGGSQPNTSLCEAGPSTRAKSYCVANPGVSQRGNGDNLTSGLRHACQRLQDVNLNCTSDMPDVCAADPFASADWVFSNYVIYFNESIHAEDAGALCEYLGPAAVYTPFVRRPACLASAAALPRPRPSINDNTVYDDLHPNLFDLNYSPAGNDGHSPSNDDRGDDNGSHAELFNLVLCVATVLLSAIFLFMVAWCVLSRWYVWSPMGAEKAAPPSVLAAAKASCGGLHPVAKEGEEAGAEADPAVDVEIGTHPSKPGLTAEGELNGPSCDSVAGISPALASAPATTAASVAGRTWHQSAWGARLAKDQRRKRSLGA
jgi:hypothetical protein